MIKAAVEVIRKSRQGRHHLFVRQPICHQILPSSARAVEQIHQGRRPGRFAQSRQMKPVFDRRQQGVMIHRRGVGRRAAALRHDDRRDVIAAESRAAGVGAATIDMRGSFFRAGGGSPSSKVTTIAEFSVQFGDPRIRPTVFSTKAS